jgi:hypothetical protein
MLLLKHPCMALPDVLCYLVASTPPTCRKCSCLRYAWKYAHHKSNQAKLWLDLEPCARCSPISLHKHTCRAHGASVFVSLVFYTAGCFEMGAMDAWCFALHLQHTPCQGSLGLQWACQLVLPLYHVAKGSQLEETKHVLTVSQLPKPESEI